MERTFKLALLSLPFALALPANAQSTKLMNPFSVRLGASFLTHGDSRDFARASGLTLGLSYDLAGKSFISPGFGVPSIDVDWQRHEDDGNRLDSFDIMYVERVPLDQMKVETGSYPYWGAGVGLFYNYGKARDREIGNGGGGGSGEYGVNAASGVDPGDDFSRVSAGLKLILGYRFNQQFFAEAGYRFSGSVEGLRTDGLTLSLGVRF